MKINTSMTFIGFCCLILPITSFAATIDKGNIEKRIIKKRIIKMKAHEKAVAACKGEKAGDSVEFINIWGKKIKGICVDEEGTLIAISVDKLRN